MAAGMTIPSSHVEPFAAAVERVLQGSTTAQNFVPIQRVDNRLELSRIDPACLDDLDRMEPHGPGNPSPTFLAVDVIVKQCREVGGSHLKLMLEQDGTRLGAIGFGMAEFPAKVGDHLDVLFRPMINHWNGTTSVELRLADLRTHRPR